MNQHRTIATAAFVSLAMVGGTLLVACGDGGGSTSGSPSVSTPAAASTPTPSFASALPASPATPAPAPTAAPSPTPPPTASPTPPAPATSPTPAASPTPASPTGQPASTGDDFWALVARGVGDAGRLEVEVRGPTPGTLRFQKAASATVIDGTVGFVCLDGHAYDGQSAFTALPGTWTCGAAALVAGFRHIGQPIDAWNDTIPSDDARRESVVAGTNTLTWKYRGTSAYYGGPVSAEVTIERKTGRVTAATREDPTGPTTYVFRYGVAFPAIAIPR